MADSNTLHIVNYFTANIDATVTGDNWNCCDQPARGTVVGNIAAGGMASMVYVRTDGHGCDGCQGQFQLAMNSAMLLNMDFDSNGGIEISNPPSGFAAFLSPDSDGTFTLIVGATPNGA